MSRPARPTGWRSGAATRRRARQDPTPTSRASAAVRPPSPGFDIAERPNHRDCLARRRIVRLEGTREFFHYPGRGEFGQRPACRGRQAHIGEIGHHGRDERLVVPSGGEFQGRFPTRRSGSVSALKSCSREIRPAFVPIRWRAATRTLGVLGIEQAAEDLPGAIDRTLADFDHGRGGGGPQARIGIVERGCKLGQRAPHPAQARQAHGFGGDFAGFRHDGEHALIGKHRVVVGGQRQDSLSHVGRTLREKFTKGGFATA